MPSNKPKYPNPLGISKLGESQQYLDQFRIDRNKKAYAEEMEKRRKGLRGYYNSIEQMEERLGRPLKQKDFDLLKILRSNGSNDTI